MSDDSGVGHHGHVPVLATRVRELLAPALDHDGAIYVDATLGAGGHSELMLEQLSRRPRDRPRPRHRRP